MQLSIVINTNLRILFAPFPKSEFRFHRFEIIGQTCAFDRGGTSFDTLV